MYDIFNKALDFIQDFGPNRRASKEVRASISLAFQNFSKEVNNADFVRFSFEPIEHNESLRFSRFNEDPDGSNKILRLRQAVNVLKSEYENMSREMVNGKIVTNSVILSEVSKLIESCKQIQSIEFDPVTKSINQVSQKPEVMKWSDFDKLYLLVKEVYRSLHELNRVKLAGVFGSKLDVA